MTRLFSRNKLIVTSIIASIIAIARTSRGASAGFTSTAYGGSTGVVYIIDNSATANHVLVYSRAQDGALTALGSFSTHGRGTGASLASQGAIALTSDGKWLLAVDAGSNQISVLSVHGNSLTFASKVSSHGSDPISLTVNQNTVYVLNVGGNGNIAGFTLGSSGTLTYIPVFEPAPQRCNEPFPGANRLQPRG